MVEKKERERMKLKEADRTEGADLMEVSDGEEREGEKEVQYYYYNQTTMIAGSTVYQSNQTANLIRSH